MSKAKAGKAETTDQAAVHPVLSSQTSGAVIAHLPQVLVKWELADTTLCDLALLLCHNTQM